MSSKKKINDGGSAFPQGIDEGTSEAGFPIVEITGGMTLRDYFAAKAMQGILANCWAQDDALDSASVAGQAYRLANAMLKAREAQQ